MGSIFVVTVPTRKYETYLRQYERNITVNKTLVYVDADPDANSDILDWEKSTPADTSLWEWEDVYEATVNGRKAKVITSSDHFKIEYLDEFDESLLTQSENNSAAEIISDLITDMISTVIKDSEDTLLEKHLENFLIKLEIMDAGRSHSMDGSFIQAIFTVKDDKLESVFSFMRRLGIGHKYKSTVTVCKCSHYLQVDKSGPIYWDISKDLENPYKRIQKRKFREEIREEMRGKMREAREKRAVNKLKIRERESLEVPIIPYAEEPSDALQTSSSQGQESWTDWIMHCCFGESQNDNMIDSRN